MFGVCTAPVRLSNICIAIVRPLSTVHRGSSALCSETKSLDPFARGWDTLCIRHEARARFSGQKVTSRSTSCRDGFGTSVTLSLSRMDVVAKAVGRLFSSRYLFITNTVSYGVLMTAGDAAVQGIERMVAQSKGEPQPEYDWRRTGCLGGTGLLMGPFNHVWYSFLDRVLPGSNTATVVRKILSDQLIASPFFAFAFFAGTGTLEGQPVRDTLVEFKKKFWAVYKADWTLWPAAQAINFYFLPPQFRVVYVAVVTCAWDGFLSYIKHESNNSTESTEEATQTNVRKNGQNELRPS